MQRPATALLACLAFGLLAACDATPTPATTPAVPVAASPATVPSAAPRTGSTPACADADFDAFLARFEASADAQRAAIADPLTVSRVDLDAQPEPATVTRQVARAAVDVPVLANAATRQSEGSTLRTTTTDATRRDVVIALPDTGAQTRYVFQAQPCWTLTAMHDEST